MTPQRIQRSRAKGWKQPPDTVYVGRPSKWGNPFIVGTHGTQKECAELYAVLLAGYLNISTDRECVEQQRAVSRYVAKHYRELKGRNLSCFCSTSKPCHADVLLKLANGKQITLPVMQVELTS